eukprot:2976255-Karenia_brevis.AAC.1
MFEEWKSDLTAQFLGAMQNSTQSLLQNVSGMLDTRLAPVHAHINNHSAMLAAINHRQDMQEAQIARLTQQQAMDGAAQPTEDPGYDRATARNVLSVEFHESCVKAKVKEQVQKWLAPNFENDMWELLGDDATVAKRFVLRFKGEQGLASRRAYKAMQTLRSSEDRSWIKYFVESVGGEDTQMYVDVDRNPKQKRGIGKAKLLAKISAEEFPDHKYFLKKDRASISVEWKTLAFIDVDFQDRPPIIKWAVGMPDKLGIDIELIKAKFAEREANGGANAAPEAWYS